MTKARLFPFIVLLIVAALVFGACSNPGAGTPDMVGWIESVQSQDGQDKGQLLINSPGNTTSDKFVVRVTDKTSIRKYAGKAQQSANFSDLAAGQKVEVWFTGPVMESYPAQATAEKIVIVEVAAAVTSVEISYDEFMSEQYISKEARINLGGTLVVALASNPATGYGWSENATIGDQMVLQQYEHKLVPAQSPGVIGAAGKETWSFKSLKRGSTTVKFEYSRPWEGGEKGTWTFTLNVAIE